jgi:hypothetical protein
MFKVKNAPENCCFLKKLFRNELFLKDKIV